MIDFDNQTQLPIATHMLEQILAFLGGGDVELLCVDAQTMRTINKEHRDKDETTDVLVKNFLSDMQPSKMPSSIIWIDAGNSISVKDLQFLNAFCPIAVTLIGIISLFIGHFWNAACPID